MSDDPSRILPSFKHGGAGVFSVIVHEMGSGVPRTTVGRY